MPRFVANASTLSELQWRKVLDALSASTRTVMGSEAALDLPFLDDRASVERQLDLIDDAWALSHAELSSPNHDVDDIRGVIERLAKSAVLSGTELLNCSRVIQTAARVRAFFKTHALLAPKLGAIADRLPQLNPIGSRITDMVDPSGALKDSASDALFEYRNRARSLHQSIQSKIKAMLDDPSFVEFLRESYYSVRNDRYVLPVVSSFRSKVPGIVHNASGTGQTIFVEPEPIIGPGNDLLIAQSLVQEEEQRLYTELSTDLADYTSELTETLDRLGRIDLIEACASLGNQLGAARPTISDDDQIILPEARHPVLILQGKGVVANRIELSADQRALVVSGPNAGGKTVTIATLGLTSLMLRAGLPVTGGDGCRLPLLKGVGSVIGDAQDMGRDLSTFTAHLTRLASILELAGTGWLVLVDEIAADTDPSEGAALAVAILEQLVDHRVRVAVTTHLDDVKAIAITDGRFVNARMAIDPASMRPSYELQLGTAGISNALEMARQSGLPEPILERAQQHLREGSKLSVALAVLEKERIELDRARRALATTKAALEAERQSVAFEQEQAAQARRDAKHQAYAEVENELGEARAQISRTIAEIQGSHDMRRAQKLQKEVDEQLEAVQREEQRIAARTVAAEEAAGADEPAAGPVEVGSRVRLATLGQEGEVLERAGEEVVVAVGALRTRVKLQDLVALPQKKQPSKAPGKPDRAAKANRMRAATLESPDSRLDIRGMRVDDAERELRQFVDLLVLKGPPTGLVIHGHGAGILRQMVRQMLEETPDVAAYRAGDRHEGGDGVTVFDIG